MRNEQTGWGRPIDCWHLARPFTLVAPALGMLSGAVTAWGAGPRFEHRWDGTGRWLLAVVVGTLAAAVLNAASNTLNQVYDLEIDRLNRPERVLPSGRMSPRAALWLSVGLFAVALAGSAVAGAGCLLMFALASAATIAYSVPPLRLKRLPWIANLTIAIPRGLLLKVAGWSTTKAILAPEAWAIGLVFGLFLFGASSTKDFADVEGDRAGGCRTLPLIYGKNGAVRAIYPFHVIPFLLLPAGAWAGVLSGNRWALTALGLICAVWGHLVMRMLLRDPSDRIAENHPSWYHMYLLMFCLQIGTALAYLL